MIDYIYSDLLMKDSTRKDFVITTEDGSVNITNSDLHQENFELSESLCSEEDLRFGACESNSIKFRVSNIFTSLIGKKLLVQIYPEGKTDYPLQIGIYKVQADTPTADRKFRDIVAYDAIYDIVNSDCADWYNALLPNENSSVTLKQFRNSFFQHFGIEQEEAELVNDNMVVQKTIQPTQLSGHDVLKAICEINGCFGNIGRNGKFQYVVLEEMIEGLYPADDLYPQDELYPQQESGITVLNNSHYSNAKYDDYLVERINKLQIRQEENDIGAVVGTGDNAYVVQGNFIVYGKSSAELNTVASNMFNVIKKVWYRPAEIQAKGNPMREIGDGIRLWTKYQLIYTYILNRTIKGIQALKDEYSSKGSQYRVQQANSVRASIEQLKGKTNVLERSVDETKSTITDVEKGLQSQITQQAGLINMKVSYGGVSSALSIEPSTITIQGNRLIIESTNFTLTADGTASCNSGIFSKTTFKDGIFYRLNYNGVNYDYPVIVVSSPGNVVFGVSQMNTNFPGSLSVNGFISMGGNVVATQSSVNAIRDNLQAQIDALKSAQ